MTDRLTRIWPCALGLLLVASSGSEGQTLGTGLEADPWNDDWPESEIATLLEKVEANATRKRRVQDQLAALSDERRQAHKALRATARAFYRTTRTGILPFAGAGFETLMQRRADVKRLRRAVAAGVAKWRRVERRHHAVQREGHELEAEMTQARTRLQDLERRVALTRDGVHAPANGPFGALAGPGSGDSGDQGFYGLRVLDPDPGGGFARQRGNLASPVTGEFVLRRSRREESAGLGLEFVVGPGTIVRAAAAGRVAFCDRHGGYGRLVILDHGDDYYTVYGGLGAVEVRVGDDLSRNARVGTVGSDSSPPALFFEVRRGTKTLPTRTWLGL